ncbi:hypothetical protein H359_0926 [Chlamydia ibidis 10-1398/6]|uniref:Uncharacterized protein n=1 Tax=Chlamydia ibidis 10-1398/6 TaxID=1046581 RepID=A0ABN0MYH8_9CHLA|nr:hypothetical protein H359_0926 [Chlamydia ibidis 10-1398/6]
MLHHLSSDVGVQKEHLQYRYYVLEDLNFPQYTRSASFYTISKFTKRIQAIEYDFNRENLYENYCFRNFYYQSCEK